MVTDGGWLLVWLREAPRPHGGSVHAAAAEDCDSVEMRQTCMGPGAEGRGLVRLSEQGDRQVSRLLAGSGKTGCVKKLGVCLP